MKDSVGAFIKRAYAATRGLRSIYTLTYGKDFTHLIRDLHSHCMYPDSLPNFASNFRLGVFRRAVHYCCRRSVPNPQEDFQWVKVPPCGIFAGRFPIFSTNQRRFDCALKGKFCVINTCHRSNHNQPPCPNC